MIQALLRRVDDRTFRADISADELLFFLGRLLEAALCMDAEHQAAVKRGRALVISVFRHGTENPASPQPVNSSSAGTRTG